MCMYVCVYIYRPTQQVTYAQSIISNNTSSQTNINKFHIVRTATKFSISSILLHACTSNEKKSYLYKTAHEYFYFIRSLISLEVIIDKRILF